jgi:hypothetical protein
MQSAILQILVSEALAFGPTSIRLRNRSVGPPVYLLAVGPRMIELAGGGPTVCILVVNEAEALTVRRIFEGFTELTSGAKLTTVLRASGVTTKNGKPIDKGDVYKLLNNRTYVGEVAHKGQVYPGEHQAIISRELWD